MPSIFTKIIEGAIPCYKIAESEKYFAFLDINPLASGHTLVVPKIEIDLIFNLDDDTLAGLMVFAKQIAIALERSVDCTRVGMIVAGLEVPHAHIHLVPMVDERDLSFSKPRVKMTKDEFFSLAEKIQSNL